MSRKAPSSSFENSEEENDSSPEPNKDPIRANTMFDGQEPVQGLFKEYEPAMKLGDIKSGVTDEKWLHTQKLFGEDINQPKNLLSKVSCEACPFILIGFEVPIHKLQKFSY